MKYFASYIIFLTLAFPPKLFAVESISPAKASELVRQGAAELIDVRERSEIEAKGIATPALWLATSEVTGRTQRYSEFVKQLDPKRKLIFYCVSGRRAAQVAEHFSTLRFQTLNMGGFDDWVKANLPVRAFDLKVDSYGRAATPVLRNTVN